MFKVGIIGTENSHAAAFISIFATESKYADIQVTHIGGMYREASEKIKNTYPDIEIVDNAEDMIGKIDAVMITCRDGQYHYPYVKPFLEAGIPAFIDKPLTRNVEEAEELIALAKAKNVPICGGSAVKECYDILMLANIVEKNTKPIQGGSIIAPLNMVNDYGGFWFYSSHLAEMTLRVFGYNPIEVTAQECNEVVTVMTKYENFIVTNQFVQAGKEYFGQVICDGMIYSRNIDVSMIYQHECDLFAQMLRTGEMPHTYEELMIPVKYLAAVEKSYLTKTTVKL